MKKCSSDIVAVKQSKEGMLVIKNTMVKFMKTNLKAQKRLVKKGHNSDL
jgi:hypothetical protein